MIKERFERGGGGEGRHLSNQKNIQPLYNTKIHDFKCENTGQS